MVVLLLEVVVVLLEVVLDDDEVRCSAGASSSAPAAPTSTREVCASVSTAWVVERVSWSAGTAAAPAAIWGSYAAWS